MYEEREMNDQMMRLAKEAGFLDGDLELFPETIERFAELVAADECERIKEEFKSQYYLSEKDVKEVVDNWKEEVANLKTTIQLLRTLEQTGKKTVRKKFTELSDDDVSRICFDWYEFMKKNKTENLRHLALQIAIKLKERNT
jgi:SMC interacting uncharacterized protein involved in chromosome segregation